MYYFFKNRSLNNMRFLLTIVTLLGLSACVETPFVEPPPAPLPEAKLIEIIDGYTDKLSYKVGDELSLFLNAESVYANGIVELFDVRGNKVSQATFKSTPQSPTTAEPWADGFGYDVSLTYSVPELTSGMYLWANKIPFLVRNDALASDIKVLWASNTMNAYICSGGKNLYSCGINDVSERPHEVSFQRPLMLRSEFYNEDFTMTTDWEGHSLPFIRWLDGEAKRLNVTYSVISDADLDDLSALDNTKLLIIPGHNEYWTRQARLNLDSFISKGGHVANLSGNTAWWQVRYSDDGNKMISYKSSSLDPINDPLLKTDLWTTAALNYPIADTFGADFPNGGYGNTDVLELPEDAPKGWNGYKIVNASSPLLEGTALLPGEILPFDYSRFTEYDGAPLSGFDTFGNPILDEAALGFHKLELIGFDYGFRNESTVGTFIVFQKTPSSGIMVNMATNIWSRAMIASSQAPRLQRITQNTIMKLLNNENVFTQAP